MFCANCGQLVADGMKFCPHCGTPVAAVAAPAASPAARAADPAAAPLRSPGPGAGGAAATGAMDAGAAAQGLVARVKGILLSPSTEWPIIAAEASSSGAIYGRYVAPLATIGVIAGLIGHTIIGYNVPLLGHLGIGIGIAGAVVKYVLAFVGVFVDRLAGRHAGADLRRPARLAARAEGHRLQLHAGMGRRHSAPRPGPGRARAAGGIATGCTCSTSACRC